jgi:hypothetical protein
MGITLDANHGAPIVWLTPMREELPRGLPATLIAANLAPGRLGGHTEPAHRSGNRRSRGSTRSRPNGGPACVSPTFSVIQRDAVYRCHLGDAQFHRGPRFLGQEAGGNGAGVGEVDGDFVAPPVRGICPADREHRQWRLAEPEGDQLPAGGQVLARAQEERDPAHRLLSISARTAARVSVCGSARLKRNRAVVTRYDNLAVRYEATVHSAAINEWLPRHL